MSSDDFNILEPPFMSSHTYVVAILLNWKPYVVPILPNWSPYVVAILPNWSPYVDAILQNWSPYVVAILPNWSPYIDVRLSECPLGGAAIFHILIFHPMTDMPAHKYKQSCHLTKDIKLDGYAIKI